MLQRWTVKGSNWELLLDVHPVVPSGLLGGDIAVLDVLKNFVAGPRSWIAVTAARGCRDTDALSPVDGQADGPLMGFLPTVGPDDLGQAAGALLTAGGPPGGKLVPTVVA